MSMNWPEKVIFCEVGPRDGLQNEKTLLSVEQKVALIEGAADAGVPIIEVGSFVHPKAVPQMADTDEVAKNIRRLPGVEYRCLVANKKGVERALASGITKVKLTLSASESHARANMKNLSRSCSRASKSARPSRTKTARRSQARYRPPSAVPSRERSPSQSSWR